MENISQAGHVAIIEKCMMSREGLQSLFSEPVFANYSFHFFKDHIAFRQALKKSLPISRSSIRFLVSVKSGANA